MKFSICGFSQAQIIKFNNSHPKEAIDVFDLHIFQWFIDFTAIPIKKQTKEGVLTQKGMWRKIFDNEVYYWVNYKSIMEEFPMLGITSEKTIARKFEKYVSGGLMKRKIYGTGNGGSKVFYAFTEEFRKFKYDNNDSSQKINPYPLNTDSSADLSGSSTNESDSNETPETVISDSIIIADEKTELSARETKESLTRRQDCPLENTRKDKSVRSPIDEKTRLSAPLNNPSTMLKNPTTTTTEFNQQYRQQILYLKNYVGKYFDPQCFSGNFWDDLLLFLQQSSIPANSVPDYIDFVYQKTVSKKPESLINYFYKVVCKPYFPAQFVQAQKQKSLEAASNTVPPSVAELRICPVCNCGYNKTITECPTCKIPRAAEQIPEQAAFYKAKYQLRPDQRAALENELSNLLQQGGFSGYQNPAELKKQTQAIYAKYGIKQP